MAIHQNNTGQRTAQCAPATIAELFAEWLPLFNLEAATYTPEGLRQALARMAELSVEISSRHALTAKDLAMQLVARSNAFEFDLGDDCINRVVAMATRVDVRQPQDEREQKWGRALIAFKAAAMEYDPSIFGFWVSHSERDIPGSFSNVDGVWFSRSRKLEEHVDHTTGEVA